MSSIKCHQKTDDTKLFTLQWLSKSNKQELNVIEQVTLEGATVQRYNQDGGYLSSRWLLPLLKMAETPMQNNVNTTANWCNYMSHLKYLSIHTFKTKIQ